MATVIDQTIFKGDLFIPNTMDTPSIKPLTPANKSKLNIAIETYERLLLINALGVTQYTELMSHLTDTTGKWYDLINGVTYDDKRFEGIKPIIAYFVYVNFLKEDSIQYNTTGLERSDAQNSTSVNPIGRLVDYWNRFYHMYQGEHGCICYFNNQNNTSFVTLHKYLSDFPELYNLGFFRFYRIQNILGI